MIANQRTALRTSATLVQITAAFLLVLVATSLPGFAQSWPSAIEGDVYKETPLTPQCSNGSFEQGFTDWVGFRGKRLAGLPYENKVIAPTSGPLLSTSCVSTPPTGNSGSGNSCHLIQGSGTDPNLPSVSHPMTQAGGSSLRLGGNDFANRSNGFVVEGAAKRFIVQPANAIYRFRYSSVMDKAHDNSTAFTGDEPYFQAIAIDPATGAVIAKIDQPASGFNPLVVANPDNASMVYSLWTCAELDLSAYVGKEVIVYFINADCSQSFHLAYTYIDDVCTTCGDDITIDPAVDTELKICDPSKQAQINGTFTVPAALNTSNVTVSIEIKQAGSTVNTLTGGTITGNAYSFNLAQSDLKGLGCYDFVAVLEYDVTTPSGNVVHVKKQTSAEGFKPGADNDVCVVDCPPPPKDTCLKPKVDVECGKIPGTYVLTLDVDSSGSMTPDKVQIVPLTPGVTLLPAKPFYKVNNGKVKVTVVGAAPGDVIELQVNGVAKGQGSVEGSDLCCSGVVSVTIPQGLDCEPKEPKLKVVKTCEPAAEVAGPILSYEAKCKISVTATGPVTGTLSLTDLLGPSGGSGTTTGINSAEPWNCLPSPPPAVAAGTPIACSMSGADLNAAGGASTINVTLGFTSLADITDAKQCARLELKGKPVDESCTGIKPPPQKPTLTVAKTCDPAVPSKGGRGADAACRITVTATGAPLPDTVTIDDVLTAQAPGSEITTLTSADNWACDPVPVNAGTSAACSITGADLAAAGGQSVIDVTVHIESSPVAQSAQQCVSAAGLDANGQTILTAPQSCVPLTIATTTPPSPPPPPPVLKCDPATAKLSGGQCRCTVKGMVPVSKTACGCADGTRLSNGRCVAPPPRCDVETTTLNKGQCVCRYRNMQQSNARSCQCRKGYDFVAGRGCVATRPVCKDGTRFSQRRNRCEPVCAKGQVYEARRNICIKVKEPPKCDMVTAVPRGDACACRYPGMSPNGQSCSCAKGERFQRGRGCVKVEAECKDGTRFSPRRQRCEPVCAKDEQYDPKRNACRKAEGP